jgi:heterotetrameric sarcosine oxidase delta subunit
MTFLITCPNCGLRDAEEFSYGGESTTRPAPDRPGAELARYVYFRRNVDGWQSEWWYHRDGCQRWFVAERHTSSNRVRATYWPADAPDPVTHEPGEPEPSGAEVV